MKKLLLPIAAIALISCEKKSENTLKSTQVVIPTCECHVYELKSINKIINGRPVVVTEWREGRYFSDDCSDQGFTFQEMGEAREVRCDTL